jgi:hypothetical protein
MPKRTTLFSVALLGCLAAIQPVAGALGADLAASDKTFKAEVSPLLAKYCINCHSGAKPKGSLDLNKYSDTASVLKGRKVWERLLDALQNHDMPPEGKPRPTETESLVIVGWLQSQLTSAECTNTNDPGKVTLRRLNRVEYNNTMKDLTAVDIRPADDFPSDDVGYGFDNIGDVLSLPPILFEKYMSAAEKVADMAIVLDEPDRGKLTAFPTSSLPDSAGGVKFDGGRMLPSVAEIKVPYEVTKAGDYYLTTKAYANQAGNEPALMELRVDGKPVKKFPVPQTEEAPGRFEIKTKLEVGKHVVSVAFLNDLYEPNAKDPNKRDRNLIVERIEVQGPADSEVRNLPPSHRRILVFRKSGITDSEYASSVIEQFASRAFRRPARREEVERLLKIYELARKNGDSLERGIQLVVQATLMSPNFLFKVEFDRTSKSGEPNLINDYELATRLSYFLWSTMPDQELLDLAKNQKLSDPSVLDEQVKRMLRRDKSRALVENFAGQWLQLRNLKTINPDPKLFPDFDDALRVSMVKETEAYFNFIKSEDRSILEFLDSDYAFVNRRMAKHYGISNIPRPRNNNEQMMKVTLTDGRRGGVVTQASILTLTSNPTRTSPVKRGKWILEQILNSPPPPPPPDVPELKEDKGSVLTGSLRKRMEQHRANPNCAVCHSKLDPLGFGLENFNAIGAWRDKDGEFAIDSAGTLPGGKSFENPKELRAILMERKDDFTKGFVQKMMTYAIGRGLDYNDRCAVDKIAEAVSKDGYKFSRVITEIVLSDSFRKRRPKGAEK